MDLSNIIRVPQDFRGDVIELGEPLLFKAAEWLTFGRLPDGYSVNMHPMAFAAWFGLLATALNLFPIGQLDGGHISYALLGRRSTLVTLAMVGCLAGVDVRLELLARLDRAHGRDALCIRPASPANARRGRAAR